MSKKANGNKTFHLRENNANVKRLVTVPEPDITTKTNISIIETEGNAVTTSEDSNLLAQSKSGTSKCEKVPEFPVSYTHTNILSLTHEVIIPKLGNVLTRQPCHHHNMDIQLMAWPKMAQL